MSADPRIEAAVSMVKNSTVAWSMMASGDRMTPATANICVDEIVIAVIVAADKAGTTGLVTLMTMDEDMGASPEEHVIGVRLPNGHGLHLGDTVTVTPTPNE